MQATPVKRYTLLPWIVVLVGAFFYFYEYILRILPSVMLYDLMHTFKIGSAGIGLLSGFYFYAYTPMQFPAGVLCDRYRPRYVMTIAISSCVFGLLLFAITSNLYVAFLSRLFIGFGSAFAFVGALKLATLWLPPQRFGLVAGFIVGFGTLGAMSADIIISHLSVLIGWRETCLVLIVFGALLVVILLLCVSKKPPYHHETPALENTWAFALQRLWHTLKNKNIWTVGLIGALLYMPVSVFASLWGVGLLIHAYHYTKVESASLMSLIFLGTGIGSPFAGFISDRLRNRRWPLIVGSLITTTASALLIYNNTMSYGLVTFLLFILGFATGAQALVFVLGRELSTTATSATAMAIINFIVTLSAAIFQPVIGVIIEFYQEKPTAHHLAAAYNNLDYHVGLAVLPIATLICAIICFLVPETHAHKYDS